MPDDRRAPGNSIDCFALWVTLYLGITAEVLDSAVLCTGLGIEIGVYGSCGQYSVVELLPRQAPVSCVGARRLGVGAQDYRCHVERLPVFPAVDGFTGGRLSGTRHGPRPWGKSHTRRSRVMDIWSWIVDAGGILGS